MSNTVTKNFSAPDERQSFPNAKAETIALGDWSVRRVTFEPGWKWSLSLKPIVKTETCPATHRMYVLSGRMHIVMDDGQAFDVGPGDAMHIMPGHDAWTVGDEACIVLDFSVM